MKELPINYTIYVNGIETRGTFRKAHWADKTYWLHIKKEHELLQEGQTVQIINYMLRECENCRDDLCPKWDAYQGRIAEKVISQEGKPIYAVEDVLAPDQHVIVEVVPEEYICKNCGHN